MHTNVGILDTGLRIVLGSIIGAVFGVFGLWIGLLALIPIITALASWCPIYAVMGWSTAPTKRPQDSDSIESLEESYRIAS